MAVASELLPGLIGVLGLTLLSGLVATLVAMLFRWYVNDRVPAGVSLLAGLSAVALYLNTRGALGAVVEGQVGYLAPDAIVFNTVAFLTSAAVTPAGQRIGDRLATSSAAFSGAAVVEGEVSQFVTTVGRLGVVTLPETIEDIDGYDPVAADVKSSLAGKTFIFPRRLTVAELRTRLSNRLKDDYEVGYVDLEFAGDGSVEYLALGRRIAGIGPTLGPGAAAVAVEADPPNSAGAGDLVQVWSTDGDSPSGVATAEIRGVAGDVVTLALDEHDATDVAGGSYRLLTLPAERRPDREFAGLLRSADETMAAVEVEADTALVGTTIGDLGATVVAVKPASRGVQPVPQRSRIVEAGDVLYVVARPDAIRRLEAGSAAT